MIHPNSATEAAPHQQPAQLRKFEIIWGILLRGIAWGTLAGAWAGFGIGLFAFLIGSLYGIFIGALTGCLVGCISGLCLAILTAFRFNPPVNIRQYRFVGAVVCVVAVGLLTPIAVAIVLNPTSGEYFWYPAPTLVGMVFAYLVSRRITGWYVRWSLSQNTTVENVDVLPSNTKNP